MNFHPLSCSVHTAEFLKSLLTKTRFSNESATPLDPKPVLQLPGNCKQNQTSCDIVQTLSIKHTAKMLLMINDSSCSKTDNSSKETITKNFTLIKS